MIIRQIQWWELKKRAKFCDLLKEDNLVTKKKITKETLAFVECQGACTFSGAYKENEIWNKGLKVQSSHIISISTNTKLMDPHSWDHPLIQVMKYKVKWKLHRSPGLLNTVISIIVILP